jgi:hypothetical protein
MIRRYCIIAVAVFDINTIRSLAGNAMRGIALVLALTATLSVPTMTAVAQEFSLVIRDHKFEPAEIRVPARKRVSIKVEKVIPGKSKGLVRIGPLEPGRYEFIGEFHADTAKGVVIAE